MRVESLHRQQPMPGRDGVLWLILRCTGSLRANCMPTRVTLRTEGDLARLKVAFMLTFLCMCTLLTTQAAPDR